MRISDWSSDVCPSDLDDPDALVSIRMWAEKGRVITISFRSIAAYETVAARFMNGEIFDPGDLIAAIAHEITASLDPDVAALGDRLDDIASALDGSPPAEIGSASCRERVWQDVKISG